MSHLICFPTLFERCSTADQANRLDVIHMWTHGDHKHRHRTFDAVVQLKSIG